MTDPIFGPWLPGGGGGRGGEAHAQGSTTTSPIDDGGPAPLHPYGHDLRMLQSTPAYADASSILTGSPAAAAGTPTRAAGSSTTQQQLGHPSSSSRSSSNLSPLNWPAYQPPPPPPRRSSGSPLLRLPAELRDMILVLVLPHTIATPKGIAWVRSRTAILATCKIMHAQGTARLYGHNTFVLHTGFRGTSWHCAWVVGRHDAVPSGGGGGPLLVPSRERVWPTAIAGRYRDLLRHVVVAVTVEDAYSGEIKYGFGGLGLAEGVRTQVQCLVRDLAAIPELATLTVRLCAVHGGVGRTHEQRIIAPFSQLRNVGELTLEQGRAA